MGVFGKIGTLNEATAGIRVPFNIIYESLPPVAIRMSPISAIGISQMAGTEGRAEQALPVDIYSLIEEIRRSISELKARTASIPEIYTYYIPVAAQAPIHSLSGMPEPGLLPVGRPPFISEHPGAIKDNRYDGRESESDFPVKPTHALDNGVIQSNLALGKLREDYAGLTRDLLEIERLIDEAMRSSVADIPAIVSATSSSIISPREMSHEHVERPAPDVVVIEKTINARAEEAGKESARDKGTVRRDIISPGPAMLASILAQGIGLPNIIRKSTMGMMMIHTMLTTESPVQGTIAPVYAAGQPPEYGHYIQSPVVTVESRAATIADNVSGNVQRKPPTSISPVTRAMDINRVFNDLIGSYLAFRSTTARRGAMREGVTQLLLSLPEQQATKEPISSLFDVIAGLQAARPKAVEMPPPIKTQEPATLTAPSTRDETVRSTILGDLREIHSTMASLQDAIGSLQRVGMTQPEASQATEILAIKDFADASATFAPAAAVPASEEMSGILSGIYISIARLQAAMDYLKANVPTLADFVVLQKAMAGVPPVPAVAMLEAGTPVAIAIEGVRPKSAAPLSLPDLSWVSREFGQMQGMIARLQVPMYAEGGLVEQPTLAFVGEAEPEWIVPQSVLADFQSNIVGFQSDIIGSYSLLWSEVQELGTSMQEAVDGVNTALEGLQAAGGEESDTDTFRAKFVELMDSYVDEYLGPLGFSMENLKNLGTATGLSSMSMGTAAAIIPRVKNLFTEDEEEEKGGSGGGKEGAKEEDDEEDFWKMIDDLDKATSISDKRKGKFESE